MKDLRFVTLPPAMGDATWDKMARHWANAQRLIDIRPLTDKERAYGLKLIQELGLQRHG